MKHMIFHHDNRRPINEGDAGIVFTKDGGFFTFSSGEMDVDNLTEIQSQQAVIIDAFRTALCIPAMLMVLVEMANDKSIMTGVDLLEKQALAAAH